MQIINKFFIVIVFLCCSVAGISAKFLKRRDNNLYVWISQDNQIVFIENKRDATSFGLTDEVFIHGRVGFSKNFNLVYESQEGPLFLVCNKTELKLIPKKELMAKKYFWQGVRGYENCKCYHYKETTMIGSPFDRVFSVED